MKDIITQSRSNSRRKINAKLKKEGQIIKPGRPSLNIVPLQAPVLENISIPIAPSLPKFQAIARTKKKIPYPLQQQMASLKDLPLPQPNLQQIASIQSSSPGTLGDFAKSTPIKKSGILQSYQYEETIYSYFISCLVLQIPSINDTTVNQQSPPGFSYTLSSNGSTHDFLSMSTSASYGEFTAAVDSLSSVTSPGATYWYRTIENGEQIIWDQNDYKKFCAKLQESSVMITLEGWVCIEKTVCSNRLGSLIDLLIF